MKNKEAKTKLGLKAHLPPFIYVSRKLAFFIRLMLYGAYHSRYFILISSLSRQTLL